MPHPLKPIPVNSSTNVSGYQHCAQCQGLYIWFRGNQLYKYQGVTEQEWISLRQAHSKTNWIQRHLKDTARPFKRLATDRTQEVAASAGRSDV